MSIANNRLKIIVGVFIAYVAIMFGSDYMRGQKDDSNTISEDNLVSAPANNLSTSVEPSLCEKLGKDTSIPIDEAIKKCADYLLKKQRDNNPLASVSTLVSNSNLVGNKSNEWSIDLKQRDMLQFVVRDPNNAISSPTTAIYLSVLSLAMQCEDLLENFGDRGLTTISASLYTELPTDTNTSGNVAPAKPTEVFRVRVQKSDLPKIKAWLSSRRDRSDYELAKDEKFYSMWQIELDKYKDLQYDLDSLDNDYE
jgi:hypothetical protein